MFRRLLSLAILFVACTRSHVVPSVEPPQVTVEVARSSDGNTLVSRAALLSIDPAASSAVIYVVQGDRAVRRDVAIGRVTADGIEVVSGIAPGEEVVTRGAANLRNGDPVRTVSRSGI